MSIKSLIIDDDPFIRDLLNDKLNLYLPQVIVIDFADSGDEGIKKIAQHNPDLIFLDVEMMDMTGFEMLSRIEKITFQTIFITSFSHYAIKAIRFNALDYLVKPIDLGELKQAIERYQSNLSKAGTNENIEQALINLKTKNVFDQKLTLQTQEGELRMALKNIIRIEGERNYSYIYLSNQKKKLVSKTLGDLEEILNEKGFFRCHKSHLVNFKHIESFNSKSLTLTIKADIEIPVARRKKDTFKEWFESFA